MCWCNSSSKNNSKENITPHPITIFYERKAIKDIPKISKTPRHTLSQNLIYTQILKKQTYLPREAFLGGLCSWGFIKSWSVVTRGKNPKPVSQESISASKFARPLAAIFHQQLLRLLFSIFFVTSSSGNLSLTIFLLFKIISFALCIYHRLQTPASVLNWWASLFIFSVHK